ncbi:MAG: hypothetical protein ABF633_08235 [Clostridium sp.]|uniref:DUF7657 domain-containing protein n=1 Tax=Clostridium sp. TaxID=1506 RepID=UPI0039E874CC
MNNKGNIVSMNKILKYRYFIGLIIFIILVLFKIHGSSIGIWENYVTTKVDTKNTTNLLGKSRGIRSDEWEVQTPYYLSQAMNNKFYPVVNDNITTSGQNMIVSYNAPVMDVSILAKPLNWGFLLLGKEYGLSWYWCMKIILLFLLSFEISMILTKQDRMISLLGAFWIVLSPAVQWWFMQHVGDLVFYMEAIVVTFYYIFKYFNVIKMKILFCILFSLSCIGFALVLYPALQVPMAYLCLVFMILIIMDYRDKIKFKSIDIIIFIFTIVFILSMLIHVVLISKGAIMAILNTSYPGKRISNGGDLTYYYINVFLTNIFLPYKDINFLNNCEISSFYNFLPASVLMLFFIFRKNVENIKYGIALILCSIIEIFYMLFKIPIPIAKITFLSYVPGNRMMIVYGITSVFISIWMLATISKNRCINRKYSFLISIIITATYVLSVIYSPMKSYLNPIFYILLFILFFMLNYLFSNGLKKYFCILMLIVILISGITVNPIARGEGAIYNNYLSYRIQNIRSSEPNGVWISAENDVMGAFLYANGVKTLNGIDFYPDFEKWNKIDPDEKYKDIYNRYEHITFKLYKGETSFKLLAPDNIEVMINNGDLKKLNINYILTKENLSIYDGYDNIYFREMYGRDRDGFYIFKVLYK